MSKSTFRTILAVVVAVVVYTSYRYSEDIINTLSNINFSTVRPISNREGVGTGEDMNLTGDDMMLTGDDMMLTGDDMNLTGEEDMMLEEDMMDENVVEMESDVDVVVNTLE